MRVWELATGLLTHLSEEEDDLVVKLLKDEDGNLTEREEIIAQRLVGRGVLIREDHDNCSKFKINYRKDVWRD